MATTGDEENNMGLDNTEPEQPGPPPSTSQKPDNVTKIPAKSAPPVTNPLKQDGVKKPTKRTLETSVDPDDGKEAPNPKRSNIPLNKTIKILCLKSLVEAVEALNAGALNKCSDDAVTKT